MQTKKKIIKNPCHKCSERNVGCHSKCKDYQEFVKYNEQKRKDMRLVKSNYSGETSWNYSRGKKHGNR